MLKKIDEMTIEEMKQESDEILQFLEDESQMTWNSMSREQAHERLADLLEKIFNHILFQ